MFALTAGVFTVASTSRTLAAESTRVHQLDKALTSIAVIRAQLGFGLVLVDLDEFAAIDTVAAVSNAEDDVAASLGSLQQTLEVLDTTLGGLEPETAAAIDQYVRLVEGRTPLEARAVLDDDGSEELEQTFSVATDAVAAERDVAITAVQGADDALGQLSTLIGFLTAFVIPSLAVIIYRLLTAPRRELLEAEALTNREATLAEIRRGVTFERIDSLRREAVRSVVSKRERVRLDQQFKNLRRTLLTLEGAQHCVFSNVQLAEVLSAAATAVTDGPTLSLPDSDQPAVWSDPALLELLVASVLTDCEKRGASNISVDADTVDGKMVISVTHDGARRSPGECQVLSAQATIADRLDLLRGPEVEIVTAYRLAEDMQGTFGIKNRADGQQVAALALPLGAVDQHQPAATESVSA